MAVTYNSIELDSQEEADFMAWLAEAKVSKVVSHWEYHSMSFTLYSGESYEYQVIGKKGLKTKKKTLRDAVYTPDFFFILDRPPVGIDFGLVPFKREHPTHFIVDTKGGFDPYGRQREFPLKQKWMLQQYGIFVNKVVPDEFFKRSWVPMECMTSKTGKERTKYLRCKNLSQIIGDM